MTGEGLLSQDICQLYVIAVANVYEEKKCAETQDLRFERRTLCKLAVNSKLSKQQVLSVD